MTGVSATPPQRLVGLIDGLAAPLTAARYASLRTVLASTDRPDGLVVVHADYGRSVGYARSGDRQGFARYLRTLVERLAGAGAELVALAAVAPHICGLELQAISPIPLVDVVDVLRAHLQRQSNRRLALLSTPLSMKTRLFGRLAEYGIVELTVAEIGEVSRIHSDVVHAGTPRTSDLEWMRRLANDLHDTREAQAIVVGGTELSLLLEPQEAPFPIHDCIQMHRDAIVRQATG